MTPPLPTVKSFRGDENIIFMSIRKRVGKIKPEKMITWLLYGK